MITESELKEQITPEIIKKMCELSEGFEYNIATGHIECRRLENFEFYTSTDIKIVTSWSMFPLLIYRAVERWNALRRGEIIINNRACSILDNKGHRTFWFDMYLIDSLTQCECAMLNCLLGVLK